MRHKTSEYFRRQQYMKRLFEPEKENAAKRRSLEVRTLEQLETCLSPQLGGGGRKGSRVEGSVATTAATPVKNVKAPAETWHWPSF